MPDKLREMPICATFGGHPIGPSERHRAERGIDHSSGLGWRVMRGPQFTTVGVVVVSFVIALVLSIWVNRDFGWLAAVGRLW